MKLVIASDIHGSAKFCRLLIEEFTREGADKLLLLGDILYHGPRNPLPEEYSPKEVIAMLSEIKEKIICVHGNCDAEIDCELLPFPVTDYAHLTVDGVDICLSHGHRAVPPLKDGSVYITGHTHVPLKQMRKYLHLNPGSVSLPKEDSPHGYIIYSNGKFAFRTLSGEQYDSIEINGAKTARRVPPNLRRKIVRRKI